MIIRKLYLNCVGKLLCMHSNFPKTNQPKTKIMTKKYSWFLFLFVAFGVQSQNKKKVDFSNFDRTGMKTSLLVTDVKPFTVLGKKSRNVQHVQSS